jgi:hypothetical protein
VAASWRLPARSAKALPSCRAAAPSSSVQRAAWTSALPSPISARVECLFAVGRPRGCDGAPQPGEAGVDRAGRDRRFSRLDLCEHGGPPGDPWNGRGGRHDGGRAQRGARRDPELSLEKPRAGRHLAGGCLGLPGRAEAAHQEDMRALVVRVEPHDLGGMIRRGVGLPAGEQREGCFAKH